MRDDGASAEVTVGAGTRRLLSTQQGAAKVASDATATVAGPTTGVQAKRSSNAISWFSPSLVGLTISGTVTFNLWGLESNLAANCGFDVLVERVNAAGTVQSTIVRSEHGTELGTTAAVKNWTAAPTSTTLNNGDRIKVTVFANDAGGNMASGQTFTFDYGAGTGVDGDSFVQFTEALVALDTRVTTELLETGIVRSSVPGNARVSTEVLEVGLLRVAPGANARVTTELIEVAIWRGTISSALRSRALLLGV
jgi:hypothetical protein